MFEDAFRVSNPGVKCKKNPIYELQNIKLIKKEDIPEGMKPDRYSELVEPDFVGKLAIIYEKDNIGRSGGNAEWCYIYDCNSGELTYRGEAIHKCVDPDYPDQNYNEKLFSILGNLVLAEDDISIPNIDLIQDTTWSDDKPGVLSYNILENQSEGKQDLEEMIIMKTVAYNKRERQDIRNNRIPLSTILEAVEIQVMKKLGYEKRNAIDKIKESIISSKISRQLGQEYEVEENQEELLGAISEEIKNINAETTIEDFLEKVGNILGREVSLEEIKSLTVKGVNIREVLSNIKQVAIEKHQNYKKIEKGIIQTTVIDLLTNNIDRHLTNWALIRDKKADEYTLGLFDHATAFFNMSSRTNQLAISESELKRDWASCSVLASEKDERIIFSKGIDVFKYIMENYREYAVEILQRLQDKLPEFERTIGYETIPNAEYDKLLPEQKAEYYRGELDLPVLPKKIIEEIKSKYKRIERDYGLTFDDKVKE